MRHLIFGGASRFNVAVLVKTSSFNKAGLEASYIAPLALKGIPSEEVIAFTLEYNDVGKAPTAFIKEYLEQLLPVLDSLGTQYLYVADSAYFKVLTKVGKVEPHHGYILDCKYPGYEHLKVVLGINYQALIYNPDLQAKLTLTLDTLASACNGTYQHLGSGIIHSAQYPKSTADIAEALNALHQYPEITADIEAFSLRFNEAGIGTCAFAWDEHNGLAFACDYQQAILEDGRFHPKCPQESFASDYGFKLPNKEVRKLLLEFFLTYKGRITWHNAAYDVKVIIYTLWMQHLLDTEGMLIGLDTMTERMDDTKIIAYLATNSTAGNVLSLKALAHEFAGNWAKEDIKDIRRIPLDELLQYNLVDTLSTWYVKKKYTPIMVADNQEALYHMMMLPSLKSIISMELNGMPMSQETLASVKKGLTDLETKYLDVIHNSGLIKMFNLILQNSEWEKDYESRKAKAKNPGKIFPKKIEAFADVQFNPNSGPQLQRLLYEQMCLPVIDTTDTGQPATGADTLEKLINHTTLPAYKELIQSLIAYGKVTKILSTFIPAFENGIVKADGMIYLHGSFNLGGTVSGRLSSSDPNLQNIPAGSTFGKLIKSIFVAPEEYYLVNTSGLDDIINSIK